MQLQGQENDAAAYFRSGISGSLPTDSYRGLGRFETIFHQDRVFPLLTITFTNDGHSVLILTSVSSFHK